MVNKRATYNNIKIQEKQQMREKNSGKMEEEALLPRTKDEDDFG